MRLSLLLLSVTWCSWAQAQNETTIARHGITANLRVFPQNSPQDTLRSAIKILEEKRFDYLIAHLLDPEMTDQMIRDRERLLIESVEKELLLKRADQRDRPELVQPQNRIPTNPQEFNTFVEQRARDRAIKKLIEDVKKNFSENPETLKHFKKYLRIGTGSDLEGNLHQISVKENPTESIFLKKNGSRWFLLNRKE